MGPVHVRVILTEKSPRREVMAHAWGDSLLSKYIATRRKRS